MRTNNFTKRPDDFKWAAVKLSVFYVLVVMAISASFSVVLFKISSNEIGLGLKKQMGFIDERLPRGIDEFEEFRIKQFDESRNKLKNNLFYFNIAILVISSSASYFLARKTLYPIEKAMDSQNRFTADASHELRTPLTAMRTEIEVALRDNKISLVDTKKLLKSNIEEIVKLETLSDALLKLARYQNGREKMETVDVQEIIVEAYERVQSLAVERDIKFQNDLKSLKVRGDKQSLVELFIIIIDNAIKYSSRGKKIEIKISDSRGGARISVRDYGIGIKASDLNHIFERFYRADVSRVKDNTYSGNGYGLGLALAKEIIEAHDGNISVVSTPGKGSEFVIFLKS